jgi:8-oxo-dGTP diphosphatase
VVKHYVTGLMFSPDKTKVALITKLNPEWQRGLLNGIGGKIESGETPVDAMCREFLEETGVRTSSDQWQSFAIIQHRDQYQVHFFVAFDAQVASVKTIEREVVSVYDVAALPNHLMTNMRWLIPLALANNIDFSQPVMVTERDLPVQG